MINCICAIAKNENQYINEWCNYYLKKLKFDRIYLYDNNDSKTEYVGNCIDKDIQDKVVIFNWRDKHYKNMQWAAYQDFYNKYGQIINWVLFCDIDEFLTGLDDINTFLNDVKFKNFDQIRVKWRLFGDDDLITRDISKPVVESFTKPIENNTELSNQGKSFVKGGLKDILIRSCHFAMYSNKSKLKTCLPSGVECVKDNTYQIIEDYSNETIFLNHYMTKSLSEFIEQKYKRGDAIKEKRNIDFDYYWQLNKKTPEKLKFIQDITSKKEIDLVVPYVDDSDPNWQKIFNECKKTTVKTEQTTASNRFRNQDSFFKYFFRCIDANMPFIRNIYLLVMMDSQVPNWINRDRIKIVTHEQFIPKEYLPTFNSGTIEMFLHNIPGLSEKFIYANDDFYSIALLKESDFFESDKCKFNIIKCSINPKTQKDSWQWFSMCQNNYDVVSNTTKSMPYYKLKHEFRPYFKSLYKQCFDRYKKQILESITQFRSEKNLTCYLFSLYLDKIGKRLPSMVKDNTISSGMSSDITLVKNKLEGSDTLCLNDTRETINIYQNNQINTWFKEKFPNRSKYEIGYVGNKVNHSRVRSVEKPSLEPTRNYRTIVNKAEPFTGLPEIYLDDEIGNGNINRIIKTEKRTTRTYFNGFKR